MQAHTARRWAWLFVVAIVIVDVVVIATALRDGGKTRQAAASPATRQSAPLYPAPEMVAPTRLSSEIRPGNPTTDRGPGPSPIAEPLPPAAPAPDPSGIQVLGVSRTADPDPTMGATPSKPSGNPVAGSGRPRTLVAIADDGAVIRADRGSCPARVPARIEISHDFGRTWTRPDLALPQILGARAQHGGNLSLVGTDASCRPTARASSNGGKAWQPGALSGWWYLNPDSHSTQVIGPQLVVDAGCVPVALSAMSDRGAAIACADGEIRVTRDAGDTWQRVSDVPGAVGIALRTDGAGVALAATNECPAQVMWTADGARSWVPLACLSEAASEAGPRSRPETGEKAGPDAPHGTQPEAIGIAGEHIAAQVGRVLFVSTDGGATWQRRSQ